MMCREASKVKGLTFFVWQGLAPPACVLTLSPAPTLLTAAHHCSILQSSQRNGILDLRSQMTSQRMLKCSQATQP